MYRTSLTFILLLLCLCLNGVYKGYAQRYEDENTGPVTNVVTTTDSSSIHISWNKPLNKADIPSGYIVTYGSPNGNCGTIIINMGRRTIIADQFCQNIINYSWTQLSTLSIKKLSPYTHYSVWISPFREKRKRKVIGVDVMTKEGKSGPVGDLRSTNMAGFYHIKFDAPIVPRGIVQGYKISIWLLKSGICWKAHKMILNNVIITHNYYDVPMKVLNICGQYRIDVAPVNGWSENNGVGQTSSLLIERHFDDSLVVSNVSVSRTTYTTVVAWYYQRRSDDCINIGFMVEIKNNTNRCFTRILSNENCSSIKTMLNKESNCNDSSLISYTSAGSYWRLDFAILYSPYYNHNMKIWSITDKVTLEKKTKIKRVKYYDCFSDCYTDNHYFGIRSEGGCVSWKNSLVGRKYSIINDTNLCIMKDKPRPFCATKENYKYCNISECKDNNKDINCAFIIHYNITISTITAEWRMPYLYIGPMIGYLTLLHSMDGICKRAHIQTCDNCPNESSFHDQIKNFYVSCNQSNIINTKGLSNQSIFTSLDQNESYIVYLITLLNTSTVSKVRKFTMATLSSDGHAVGNVVLGNIESGPSSTRLISWKYFGSFVCKLYFRINYQNKYSTLVEYKETNNSYIILDNLRGNNIFIVRVRAETSRDTACGHKYGPFSELKEFYMGIEKPEIYGYHEIIQRSPPQISISWSFNAPVDGSIFEFITVLNNSIGSCLGSINNVCEDCPDPYNWWSLAEVNKAKRLSLLQCQKKTEVYFKKATNSLNISLKLDKFITDFSITIYLINLAGVQNVYQKRTSYEPEGPGTIVLDDVKSGPLLQRTLSWKYSRSDDCAILYRVILRNVNMNETKEIVTKGTVMRVENLEKNMIYTVSVKVERKNNGFSDLGRVGKSSEIKQFFTGEENPKISSALIEFEPSLKLLTSTWILDDSLIGSMFEYVVRVSSQDAECVQSINFKCVSCIKPYRREHLSQESKSEWERLLRCAEIKNEKFTKDHKSFGAKIRLRRRFNKGAFEIFGLSLNGPQTLFQKFL